MTYANQKTVQGAEPEEFVEFEMDVCSLNYGESPCIAEIGETGTRQCFNTYATCQDKQHFTRDFYNYRFCKPNAGLPIGVNAISLLQSVTYAAQQLTPGKGLGVRASVTLKFLDAPFADDAFDKYATERGYDSLSKGTFWGKFKARHKFFQGRLLKIKTGYLTRPFSWDNFQERVYIIESITGPDNKGVVTVVAKDILKLADDDRAQCPKPNRSKLLNDIDSSQTSLTLTPMGIGDIEYPATGVIRIGSELMSFARADDVLTLVREVYNTQAEEHKANDAVQLCAVFTSQPVQAIIDTLLTTYANVPSDYIPRDDWDAEQEAYLPGVYNTVITEPTGVNKLIAELTEQGLCYLWWDEVNKLVQFRALRPPADGLAVYSDYSSFIADSVSASELANERISRFLIYFDRKDITKKLDEPSNYNQYVLGPDLESEGENEHGSVRLKTIYSRWFSSTSLGRVEILAQTLLKKYTNPPRILDFILDNRENLAMGDLFIANTQAMQDDIGDAALVEMQVIERIEYRVGHHIKFKAQENIYNLRANDFNNRLIKISFNTEDLNLYDAYVAEFGMPVSDIVIYFVVLEGILVTGSTTANFALIVDDRWPENVKINLLNNGIISGRGGDGGNGASGIILGALTRVASSGNNGGNSIIVEYPISIENNGIITVGSGGGGGGGLAYNFNEDLFDGVALGSSGGGGWPKGQSGNIGMTESHSAADRDSGYLGSNAGNELGEWGIGGANRNVGSGPIVVRGGKGGNGGELAENGLSGDDAYNSVVAAEYRVGAVGGVIGDYAISGNSFVNWVNVGTIHGDIV